MTEKSRLPQRLGCLSQMSRCIAASVRHADAIIDQMTVTPIHVRYLHSSISLDPAQRFSWAAVDLLAMVQYRRDAIDGSLASPTHTDAIGR